MITTINEFRKHRINESSDWNEATKKAISVAGSIHSVAMQIQTAKTSGQVKTILMNNFMNLATDDVDYAEVLKAFAYPKKNESGDNSVSNGEYPNSENSIVRNITVFYDGSSSQIVDNHNYEPLEGIDKWDLDTIINQVIDKYIDDPHNPFESEIDGIDIGFIPNGSSIVNMYRWRANDQGILVLSNNRSMKEGIQNESRDQSYPISKKQYDYLLPVFGPEGTKQLSHRVDRKVDKYYFIGTHEEHLDLLNRCKYLNESLTKHGKAQEARDREFAEMIGVTMEDIETFVVGDGQNMFAHQAAQRKIREFFKNNKEEFIRYANMPEPGGLTSDDIEKAFRQLVLQEDVPGELAKRGLKGIKHNENIESGMFKGLSISDTTDALNAWTRIKTDLRIMLRKGVDREQLKARAIKVITDFK
jgi:hypothetical protein